MPDSVSSRAIEEDHSGNMASDLVGFWYARWGGQDRLNDIPVELNGLQAWLSRLAYFELLGHANDFRALWLGPRLIELFGNSSQANLSDIPMPYRYQMRRALLRAAGMGQPAVEHFDFRIAQSVVSFVACALPVAGGYFRPNRLLLGMSWATPGSRS